MLAERGFGKVILFGEHFVVYGLPGIVAGLDKGIIVEVEEHNEDIIEGGWNTAPTREALNAIKKSLGTNSRYRVRVEEEVPSGAGLGASAAFTVALTRAIAKLEGKEISNEEVFNISYEGEKVYHGTPSGIDNAAATFGGLLEFRKGEKPMKLEFGRPLPLLITYTGKKGSTKELVSSVRALKEAHQQAFRGMMDAYSALYEEAKDALKVGDLTSIGELMNMNQGLLSSIGVSSKEIEEIVHTTRALGAYGSKITGAGGGGCVISLVESEEQAKEISEKLKQESFFAKVG